MSDTTFDRNGSKKTTPELREEPTRTYYDRPALKEPVWTWEVPAYFFSGGAAAGAAVLAAVAQALEPEAHEGLIRTCRRVTALGTAAGAALLISDLGRPERFLNMLRVFKPASPLNLGTYVLSATSGLAAAAMVLGRSRIGDLAGLGAGVFALPLSGYTAVLISDTAIPLWNQTRRTLPALFVASAASSAASLLAMTNLSEREEITLRNFGLAAQVAELAAGAAVERDAGRSERVAAPLREGASGMLWKASKWLTVASFALGAAAGRYRGGRIASGMVGVVGGLALRYSVVHAGRVSARDPRAAFEPQRAAKT